MLNMLQDQQARDSLEKYLLSKARSKRRFECFESNHETILFHLWNERDSTDSTPLGSRSCITCWMMLDVRFVLYGTIADKLLHKVTSHWSCSLYIDYILVVDIGWYLLIDVYCSCWSNRFLILVPVLVRCSGPCRCGTSWHARFVSHSTIQGRGLGVAPQLFGSFVADFMTCFILFLCGFYMSIHHVFLDFACAVVCEKLLRLLAIQALNLWGFAFHVTGLRPQSGAPSKVCGTWKADESRIEFDSTLSHFGVTRAHWLVEEALFLLQEVYSLAICIIYIYLLIPHVSQYLMLHVLTFDQYLRYCCSCCREKSLVFSSD